MVDQTSPVVEVAHEHEAAPRVARDVLAPARQRQLLPAAVAAAGVGQHHRVRTVRQQVRARAERVRRRVETHRRRDRTADERHVRGGLDRRILQRDELRHTLLEQQVGRLNPRIGVESLLHRRPVQDVVEREQAHALVVSHPGPQHDRRPCDARAGARACSRWIRSSRTGRSCPRCRRRSRFSSTACGAIGAARIEAYGATTRSSARPRLRPSPGTPNARY